MLGIAKGSVELFVASQLLVSNENEKSLQCAFNVALLRRPGLDSRLFLCRTSKSQLRNIVNHACMQVEINLIKHFLNLLDCKLWCFIVFDHLCFLLAFQILPVNFMFIIITLFTVVRGFDAIIAVSSMTVQNKTLKLSLVCHPSLFTYFLRCTQALFALSKICVYLA